LQLVYDKQNNLPKAIHKELFGNIVLAVGVLESEVELVVSIEHVETLGSCGAWALLCATGTVDIHRYVLL
jgi:hypothetical protein